MKEITVNGVKIGQPIYVISENKHYLTNTVLYVCGKETGFLEVCDTPNFVDRTFTRWHNIDELNEFAALEKFKPPIHSRLKDYFYENGDTIDRNPHRTSYENTVYKKFDELELDLDRHYISNFRNGTISVYYSVSKYDCVGTFSNNHKDPFEAREEGLINYIERNK